VTQHLIGIYESLGWMDDGFRTGWSVTSGGGTFVNGGTIAGDYAVMTPTSGSPPHVAFSKTLSTGLSSDTYSVARIRVRGSSAGAECAIIIWYTDSSYTNSGYFTPGTSWMTKNVPLASGKTIGTVQLWARTAAVEWDYAGLLRNPPLVPEEVEEVDVDLQTTVGVSGFRLRLLNDPSFESCVLRLPFDENFGSKAYDLSKYKNHGDISGASWVDGKHGKALSFDGVDDYVDVGMTTFAPTQMTLATWIKTTSAHVIIGRLNSTWGSAPNGAFVFWSGGAGSNAFYCKMGGNELWLNYLTSVIDGLWHLVILTWDGSTARIYVDGKIDNSTAMSGAFQSSSNKIMIGRREYSASPHYFNGVIDEACVYNRALTAEEIYDHYISSPLSGAQRASVGDIATIYLAGEGETLAEKLIKGRIIERESKGEPDNPVVELVGEAMEELLLERTYTDEFASATQVSEVAADIINDQFPEFTRTSIDATNLTIKNRFDEERVYELLKKLAETAQYGDGTKGANFWVDPGDDFHFEKVCKWSAPDLTDGSGGGTKNLLSLSVKETMKGNPKLANDLKLIIFEAEHEPKNQDSWTDVESGGTTIPYWDVDCPTPENVTIQPEYVDVKCGNACVEYNLSANPGNYIEMRCTLPSAVDIGKMTRLRVWLKRGNGIIVDANGLNFYIETKDSWWGSYHKLENLAPPNYDVWSDENRLLSSFTAVGNPGKWAARVNIRFNSSFGIGVGDIRIDKLRFERDEVAKTASDSTSQSRYGRRRLVTVDKTITDPDTAQNIVNGMLEHRKNHTVQATVVTRGKAQVGFRPPQKVKVTSLKDGFNSSYLQIISARHRYVPQDIYTCELELITAVKTDGTFKPDMMPQNPSGHLGGILARFEEEDHLQELAIRRREWQ